MSFVTDGQLDMQLIYVFINIHTWLVAGNGNCNRDRHQNAAVPIRLYWRENLAYAPGLRATASATASLSARFRANRSRSCRPVLAHSISPRARLTSPA